MSVEANSRLPNERAGHLLKVLIQRYVRDGQPVGSRTLSKDSGLELSPATIRNVMSDLEEMGLVSAPHTSAGRVPTPRGYRVFVDTLVRFRTPEELDIEKLRAQFGDIVDDPDELVNAASRMLSEVTRLAGIVTVPRVQQATLRQIEFLPLSDRRILVILVINDREVQNRILHVDREYTASELQQASNFLNENYCGAELTSLRARLVKDLESLRSTMNQQMLDLITVAQTAIDDEPKAGAYVMAGETNLMDFAELSDVTKLRRLFDAFSQKQSILDLLDRSINADGVQVFIGEESGLQIFDDVSVVTAPYKACDDTIGVLGVIGPTRMAYERVVPIVDISARLFAAAMGQRN